MTSAEIAAGSLAGMMAGVVVLAYALDVLGLSLAPWAVLAAVLTAGGFTASRVARHSDSDGPAFAAWTAIVLAMFAWLSWLAWPALMLPGRGSDLAHHLLLIDYIERAGHLAHDASLAAAMGEMAAYTPGAHVLSVLAGVWTGTDGFRAVYPVTAVSVALKLGFVFLITRRVLAPSRSAVPCAVASVALVLLARAYAVDAFAGDAFVAQVVSELFAVAGWWAVLVWSDGPSPARAAYFALCATAVCLTWPIWLGPVALMGVAVMLRAGSVPVRTRWRHVAIAIAPVACAAIVYAIGRLGWMAVARTSGAVITPSVATLGVVLPVLCLIGVAASVRHVRARTTMLPLALILVQAGALWALAVFSGAETPYMALKMGYLAVYPMAVLAAVGLAAASEGLASRVGSGVSRAVAWAMAAAIAVAAGRPLLAAPRPTPAVSLDLYVAGRWARANVPAGCVDYLVKDAVAAYWLHLAVMGQARSSARTAEVDRYDGRQALAPWITGDGRPYAIADLTGLPDEVRSRVEMAATFGTAAVIKRPGAAPCAP